MNYRIRIDTAELQRKLTAEVRARNERAAEAVGSLVVGQIQSRFVNGGDSELRWPDLWANDDAAVSRMVRAQQGDDAQGKRDAAVKRAEKSLERAKAKNERGEYATGKGQAAIRRATNKLRAAEELSRTSNPSYRKGGNPLQDTGALQASFFYRVTPTDGGFNIAIGSPLEYAPFHQAGFKSSGPNYIPLSIKGAKKPKGADPDAMGLLPGVDYVMAWRGVTVPPRPMVRFTQQDRRDIAETFNAGG
jgi:phage gpG-like protein